MMAEDTTGKIHAWEDDPGEPPVSRQPVLRPAPDLAEGGMAAEIEGTAPSPQTAAPGTAEFRYWTAADALDRARRFWRDRLPAGQEWFVSIGPRLLVRLDASQELNAYYNRSGLWFAHDTVGGQTIFTAESPDIVCHEFGHGVLDAIRPQLFNAGSTETAAFHESFGDMSALLCALSMESLASEVLDETQQRLDVSSRVSRVGEQLGWAVRQRRPDRAEPQALRDAANSWFYRRPEDTPPDGPATSLTTAPHSFSRIFTGAFLKALAGMLLVEPEPTPEALAQVARNAGRLLVDAVLLAPVVPSYFSQVAAHMLEADERQFNGRYRQALQFAFVRHGVLSLEGGARLGSPQGPGGFAAGAVGDDLDEDLALVALPANRYNLQGELLIEGCSQPKRFSVAGASPDVGAVQTPSLDRAAASFVEDLFRQGRVDVGDLADSGALAASLAYKTHGLERDSEGRLRLHRDRFDCGFGPALDR